MTAALCGTRGGAKNDLRCGYPDATFSLREQVTPTDNPSAEETSHP